MHPIDAEVLHEMATETNTYMVMIQRGQVQVAGTVQSYDAHHSQEAYK